MLTQLLPGVREFRVPLVTGYLWVVFAWILIGMPVPSKEEKTGLLGVVNAAGEYLSPAASLGVITFVAYVLGILLMVDSKMVSWLLAWGWDKFVHPRIVGSSAVNNSLAANVERADKELDVSMPFAPALSVETRRSINHITNLAIRAAMDRPLDLLKLKREFAVPKQVGDDIRERRESEAGREQRAERSRRNALRAVQPRLQSSIIREIPLLAIKLQKDHKELYETYDRERSEADFRISISLPLLAIAIQIAAILVFRGEAFASCLVFIGGLLVTVVLVTRGWRKLRDSTANIIALLRVGAVTSDALERLASIPKERIEIPNVVTGSTARAASRGLAGV